MKYILATVVTVTIVVFTYLHIFPDLYSAPIQKWDEQTNITVVDNKLSKNTFPTLHVQGQPFFEKPPLWYISTIFANTYIENSTHAGRMVSAVCGFFIILLVAFVAWRWWGPLAASTTWIVLISTDHFFVTNPGGSFSTHTFRSADVDSMHILFLMISFAALNFLPKKSAAFAGGIAAGLSVLSKSPLGLAPLIVATIIFYNKPWRQSLRYAWLAAFITILPWYIYMTILFGAPFIAVHLGYHQIARTIEPLEGHGKPFWYYLRVLIGRHFFLSWESLLGSILYLYTQKLFGNTQIRYVTIMAGATFIIPTIISTKLAWYLLPFYPFAALLIGYGTSRCIQDIFSQITSHATHHNS